MMENWDNWPEALQREDDAAVDRPRRGSAARGIVLALPVAVLLWLLVGCAL